MADAPKLELVDENSDDPLDLARLTVSQDFLETTPVKKLVTTIPIRRPHAQDFFRVHPSPSHRALLALLRLEDEREIYVVDLKSCPELQSECYVATVFTAITRTGVLFLMPVRVVTADGRANDWHLSAATAAELAMKQWIRMKANMSLRAYEVFAADPASKIPDPEWPDLSFAEILRIALKDHHPINHLDHPVAKRLRGA
jgi:hypothetical protein